ncbi:hypothetical protein CJF32_00005488 [Rutstroemia sp. NJR-2017a WRK4]|nr:hypothetical protein CJF32_00005488 [Rutstroemia sp. NJR-2017a WRK4]
MGHVYPQYRTPTKSRFFYLLEYSQTITGYYDYRILSLEIIVQEAYTQKLAHYTFVVKYWDRPAGYWRKGIYIDETKPPAESQNLKKAGRKKIPRLYTIYLQLWPRFYNILGCNWLQFQKRIILCFDRRARERIHTKEIRTVDFTGAINRNIQRSTFARLLLYGR